MKTMSSCFHSLLHDQIRDLYDAERQYQLLIPRMIENATDSRLREHMEETDLATKDNETLLREVCERLRIEPHGVVCEAMEGLIRESGRSTDAFPDSATTDAAIIANAQRIAHYEIAGFGTASAFARCIDEKKAAALLRQMARNAGGRDRRLTRIAMGGWFSPGINEEAEAVAQP